MRLVLHGHLHLLPDLAPQFSGMGKSISSKSPSMNSVLHRDDGHPPFSSPPFHHRRPYHHDHYQRYQFEARCFRILALFIFRCDLHGRYQHGAVGIDLLVPDGEMIAPVVDVPGDVDVVLRVDCDLRIEDSYRLWSYPFFFSFMGMVLFLMSIMYYNR